MSAEKEFLAGLAAVMNARGLKDAPLSLDAGFSSSMIRDLKRGKAQSPKLSTAIAIARALNLAVEDLLRVGRGEASPEIGGGGGGGDVAHRQPGLAEAPAAFTPAPNTVFFNIEAAARAAGHRPVCYRIARDIVTAGIRAGDIIVVDTALTGTAGDIVAASVSDPDLGDSRTLIARRLDPWLVTDTEHLPINDPVGSAGIYGAVIFIGRGALLDETVSGHAMAATIAGHNGRPG